MLMFATQAADGQVLVHLLGGVPTLAELGEMKTRLELCEAPDDRIIVASRVQIEGLMRLTGFVNDYLRIHEWNERRQPVIAGFALRHEPALDGPAPAQPPQLALWFRRFCSIVEAL